MAVDYSTMSPEDAKKRYQQAEQLEQLSRQRLDSLKSRFDEHGSYDRHDDKSMKLANKGLEESQKIRQEILETYPDLFAPPPGPSKTKALGLKALQGAVESPYHAATSPITMPALLESISPLQRLSEWGYEKVFGKKPANTLQKGAELVEKGGEKIYGEGGIVPIRPLADKAVEEAGMGPGTGTSRILPFAAQLGGEMAGVGALGKVSGVLRKPAEPPSGGTAFRMPGSEPPPAGPSGPRGKLPPGGKPLEGEVLYGEPAGKGAPKTQLDPYTVEGKGTPYQEPKQITEQAIALPDRSQKAIALPDQSRPALPEPPRGLPAPEPKVEPPAKTVPAPSIALPDQSVVPAKGTKLATESKPQDVVTKVPATPEEQILQGVAQQKIAKAKPPKPQVTPDMAVMQDDIIRQLELNKDTGAPLSRQQLHDKLAWDTKWDTMSAEQFDDLFNRSVDGLKEANRVGKIARSTPQGKMNPELISNIVSRIEDHPSMAGIRVRNVGNDKLELRDVTSNEIVRTLDLGDERTLNDLIKVLSLDKPREPGGTTLGMGFGALDEVTKSALNKAGAGFKRTVKAMELDNPNTVGEFWRTVAEPFESPLFFFRHSPAGSQVSEAAINAKASSINIARNALYRQTPDGIKKTDFFAFDDMPDDLRRPVERLLVEGDYVGKTFSDAELITRGLSDEQITAYHGVRELLDDIKGRIVNTNTMLIKNGLKPIGREKSLVDEGITDFETSFGVREGYLPRKWLGDWEIYITDPTTGVKSKYLSKVPDMPDALGVSAFANKFRANQVANNIKNDPTYAGMEISVEQFVKDGFAAHALERKGVMGYETKNIREVLHEYVGQQAKWEANAHFRVELKNILDNAKDLSPAERNRIQKYARRFIGYKGVVDTVSDKILNSIPGLSSVVKTSDPSGQVFGGVRNLVTHTTLGMGNFAYALVNATGIANHTYPALSRYAGQFSSKTGQKISENGLIREAMGTYFRGWKHKVAGIKSKESDLMEELVHRGVVDIQYWTESQPLKGGEIFGSAKAGKGLNYLSELSLVLGRTTEEMSRVVTAVSGYNLARRAGGDHEAGIKFATKFVAETQADFSKAGKPPIYTSQAGGTVGQFRTYAQIMIENMYMNTFEGNYKSAMKYWATTIGLGGYYGLPEAKALDHWYTTITGMSPLEEVTKWMDGQGLGDFVPTGIMSSAPGWLGMEELNMDMSGRVGIGDVIPSSPTDFVAWNKIVEPLNQIFLHADPKAALRVASINAPGLRYYMNTDSAGNVLDTKGNILYRPTEGEAAIEFFGLTPQRKGDIYRLSGIAAAKRDHSTDEFAKVKERYLRGEITAAEARKLGLSSDQLGRIRKSQNKDKMKRIIEHAPKDQRRELRESPFFEQSPTR